MFYLYLPWIDLYIFCVDSLNFSHWLQSSAYLYRFNGYVREYKYFRWLLILTISITFFLTLILAKRIKMSLFPSGVVCSIHSALDNHGKMPSSTSISEANQWLINTIKSSEPSNPSAIPLSFRFLGSVEASFFFFNLIHFLLQYPIFIL